MVGFILQTLMGFNLKMIKVLHFVDDVIFVSGFDGFLEVFSFGR